MVKIFVIVALSLVAASVATGQCLPEMRMTPAEIQSSALGRILACRQAMC
jgi:hypothetical protein